MLVITRKESEKIIIGPGVVVSVLSIRGKSVRLGFASSTKVPIYREELFQRLQGAADAGAVDSGCESESEWVAEFA
jgi:carbon storage regulator